MAQLQELKLPLILLGVPHIIKNEFLLNRVARNCKSLEIIEGQFSKTRVNRHFMACNIHSPFLCSFL